MTKHWCKECNHPFYVKIYDGEYGDFFLICPFCKKKHYRRIEDGKCIHCEIKLRHSDNIIEIRGK